MSDRSVHGTMLGDYMKLAQPPTLVARGFGKTEIVVAELRADAPETGMSAQLPAHDALLLALQLIDYPGLEYWEDGRRVEVCNLHAGETLFFDLRRDPRIRIDKPFHWICFYLSRAIFDALSDEVGSERIGDLTYRRGAGVPDQVIRNLGMSILPELNRAENSNRFFVDHVARALAGHIALTYGGLVAPSRPPTGRLAPWQERRAKEMMSANLSGSVTLDEVAQACGLSVSHFSRAFRRSTGTAPHRWLLKYRVDTAKHLLRNKALTLTDIALECGFADQSHFTRVFTRDVGTSPGGWRRCVPDCVHDARNQTAAVASAPRGSVGLSMRRPQSGPSLAQGRAS